MTDDELLDHSLSKLRDTGSIEYSGEYGAEIATFIPFVGWLKQQGLLRSRRVVTYLGMRPYYYFLDDGEYAEKPGPREWLPSDERLWPSNSTYTATRQPWHVPPDYRTRYASQGSTFARPVLFIQNKFSVEWGRGPINYLPLRMLVALFQLSEDRFDVVYSRPRATPPGGDYSADHNTACDYPDFAIAGEFGKVLVLEDFCASAGVPYNQTKLEVLAKSHLFVGVQGGGAHLLACFGSSVLLVLHNLGEEHPHAYAHGPYKYLADPPPTLLVATDYDQLAMGVDLIGALRQGPTGLQLDAAWVPGLEKLRL